MKYILYIIILIIGFGIGYLAMPEKIIEVQQDCPDVFGGIETTESWLGITSHPYDSSSDMGVIPALNGDSTWECKDCWVILKLPQAHNIKKVRINSKSKVSLNIYISDNKDDWGYPVATNLSDGEWDISNRTGQYIKIEGKNLKWGGAGKIFDVYGETIISTSKEQAPQITF